MQVYDIDTDTWDVPIHMVTARCFHTQVAIDEHRILVAGGLTGQLVEGLTATAHCEIVDLRIGETDAIADLPRPAEAPTSHRLDDGRIMVIGSLSASILDPETMKGNKHIRLRAGRSYHASVVLPGDRVVIIGGVARDSIEVVDVEQGISRMLAVKLPFALDDLSAAAMDENRVWILGGQNSQTGDTTDRTWILDLSGEEPALNDGPPLRIPGGAADQCMIITDGQIVLAGGESQQQGVDTELTTVRLLDLNDLTVRPMPSLTLPHDGAGGVALDGRVWVFGGLYVLGGRSGVPIASNAVASLRLPADANAADD